MKMKEEYQEAVTGVWQNKEPNTRSNAKPE